MNRITEDAARALVRQWCTHLVHVPPSVCLTLMECESSFDADAHAPPQVDDHHNDPRNSGAWGLLQVLQPTACDMVDDLLKAFHPMPLEMLEALRTWDAHRPACMLAPDLGSLLGCAYLDQLGKMFGTAIENLAPAYHNGPGFMRRFLREGHETPRDLPPKGKAYTIKAMQLVTKYADEDSNVHQADPPGVA
jgi:soluble lytic murein transglycosylase-like protein